MRWSIRFVLRSFCSKIKLVHKKKMLCMLPCVCLKKKTKPLKPFNIFPNLHKNSNLQKQKTKCKYVKFYLICGHRNKKKKKNAGKMSFYFDFFPSLPFCLSCFFSTNLDHHHMMAGAPVSFNILKGKCN